MIFKTKLNFSKQRWTFRPARVKIWKSFIGELESDYILVCGLGEFEYKLGYITRFSETIENFNYTDWHPVLHQTFKTVFCFEVLEHLCNPLLFLERLKEFIYQDADIFISFPSGRPQFLWTGGHFHEYGKERAEELFRLAGYKVIRTERTPIIWKRPLEYFKGIRPFLRLFWPLRCRLYHLRLSHE